MVVKAGHSAKHTLSNSGQASVVQRLDSSIQQAPVVQRVDSAIHWINNYPAGKCHEK